MKSDQSGYQSIDEYIASFPDDVQAILQQIRTTIQQAAPGAEETISYQMPTFKLHGNLIHFAGYKQHIGLYPTPSGIEQFKEELANYKGAKGSVQFPLDQPMPLDLIRRITEFRIEENQAKAAAKKSKRQMTSKATKIGQTKEAQSATSWPKGVAKPAQRALSAAGYASVEELSTTTEAELAALHGMGPKALKILREALHSKGLSFTDERGP